MGDEFDFNALYALIGAGLGLAIVGLVLRRRKNDEDGYIYDYDVDNLTEQEKEIIDSTYEKLTGTKGKHFDYKRKLSIIDRELSAFKKEEKKDNKSLRKQL